MEFDPAYLVTPVFIAWSCGGAQATYRVVWPITFMMACINTARFLYAGEKHKIKDAWKPLAMTTVCIVPIAGGIVAGAIWNN